VRRSKWFCSLLPVVVLVAQETPILCLPAARWFAVVALLAGRDAWNQNVRRFLAAEGAGVTRLAVDADMGIVAENRVGQPYGLDVCRSYFGQSCETILISLPVLQRMTLLTGFVPEQILSVRCAQLYPFLCVVSGLDDLRLARNRSTKHDAHRTRWLVYRFGMLFYVLR